jgi:hypothetical protein
VTASAAFCNIDCAVGPANARLCPSGKIAVFASAGWFRPTIAFEEKGAEK